MSRFIKIWNRNKSRSLPETSFGRDCCVIVTCTSVTRIFPPYSSWLFTPPASIATYCGNTAIFTQTQNWLFTLGRNVRHLLLRHTLLWSCQVELVRPLCVRKPLVRRGSSALGEGPDKARQLGAASADWARLETSGPARDIRHWRMRSEE